MKINDNDKGKREDRAGCPYHTDNKNGFRNMIEFVGNESEEGANNESTKQDACCQNGFITQNVEDDFGLS